MKQQKQKMKLWKKVLVGLVIALAVVGVAGFATIRTLFSTATIEPAQPADVTLVHTAKGDIRGSEKDGTFEYLGVPYAHAKERFVPASEVERWEGVYDATSVGPMSPQSGMLGFSAGNQDGTSNDSQNLNIWTPKADGRKRAVMVWLHGGGFSTGSANDASYDGAALAASQDVVVVGVNHRLGLSGFLDLSAYGEKYAESGNVGMRDIEMALQWINENIEYFGGDPNNVTVFGQSGGGAKVLALMSMPSATNLFDRGIVQSGATETMGVTFATKEQSQAVATRTLEQLGLTADDVEQLQAMDYAQIEQATSVALRQTAEEFKIPAPLTDGYAMEWGPVVDGSYLPTNPVTEDGFAAAAAGRQLLIGSNLNEWTRMMGGDQGSLTQEQTDAYAAAYPGKDSSQANKVDTLIRLPLLKIMSHKADQADGEVYAYVFAYDQGAQGAYHGVEIPFVFQHNGGDERLQAQMGGIWANFAKTGVPSAEGIPEWEPYTRESGATMILDSESTLTHHHDERLMQLLAPDYKW